MAALGLTVNCMHGRCAICTVYAAMMTLKDMLADIVMLSPGQAKAPILAQPMIPFTSRVRT